MAVLAVCPDCKNRQSIKGSEETDKKGRKRTVWKCNILVSKITLAGGQGLSRLSRSSSSEVVSFSPISVALENPCIFITIRRKANPLLCLFFYRNYRVG